MVNRDEVQLEYKKINDIVRVYCKSATYRVRATEMLDYLIGNDGIVKGDKSEAIGEIPAVSVQVMMMENGVDDLDAFFEKRCNSYWENCQVIQAEEYYSTQTPEQWTSYSKKRIPWAFVPTTDIAPENTEVFIRTLENDAGITLTSSPDTYIMIGIRGEVYDIRVDKFRTTYEESEKVLDVFEQILDFLPEVYLPDTNAYCAIDELAHLCYPREGGGIFAKELDGRTKVFPKSQQEYYIGNKGDYLAVRQDDVEDVYIIQKEIFEMTYEKIEKQA